MADGEFIVKLDADAERRLRAAAESAGVPVEDYLHDLVVEELAGDWAEDERIAEACDRDGEWLPAADAVLRFRSALHEQVKKAR